MSELLNLANVSASYSVSDKSATDALLASAKKTYETMDKATQDEIDAFVGKIDIRDATVVQNYGLGCEKKNSSFSDEYLKFAKGTSAEKDVKKVLAKLVGEVNKARPTNEGFFEKLFSSAESYQRKLKLKVQSVEGIISDIEKEMEALKDDLLSTRVDIDNFANSAISNMRTLEKYIVAGELALEKFREDKLPGYEKRIEEAGSDSERMLLTREVQGYQADFLKRLNNLRTSQSIAMVVVMQLFEIKQENKLLHENIQEALVHTIPAWKQSCAVALLQAKHDAVANATVSVKTVTEQMMEQNAKAIGAGYISALKQSQEGFISPEVIISITDDIKKTLEEVQSLEQQNLSRQLERSKILEGGKKALLTLASGIDSQIKLNELLASSGSQEALGLDSSDAT